jgi:uncharacterized LabA/DUF88 family protein
MNEQESRQAQSRNRVCVYIDGFNLYHAIVALQDHKLKWINFYTLSRSLLRQGESLGEVNLFTAVLNWNPEKQKRHRNFIAAQRAAGVVVHEGRFKQSFKPCVTYERSCKFYEEKQTDVAIAVRLVSDALSDRFERAILITADSDQVPTAEFISSLPNKRLTLYYPPNRASQARDLGNVVQDRRELTPGQLRTCMLPRTVHDQAGKAVAHMPALYSA